MLHSPLKLPATFLLQVQGYVSTVSFTEACAAIPADVLLLEIGPHLIMRSPLRQNRPTLQCAPAPPLAQEASLLLPPPVVAHGHLMLPFWAGVNLHAAGQNPPMEPCGVKWSIYLA